MIIVCDVDGTIADHTHRFHHVTTDVPKNWKAYYEKMPLDPPLPGAQLHLKRLVEMMSPNFFFLTGRPEEYRKLTQDWIWQHFGVLASQPSLGIHSRNAASLVMRPTGDYRKSHVFKMELVEFLYGGGGALASRHPMLFLDDDLRNQEMYSRFGLFLKAPECWEVMR